MSEVYVLDACALVALLNHEDGSEKVVSAYKKAAKGEADIVMNRINLLEVYYGYYRDMGKEYADKIVDGVMRSIVLIREFDQMIFPVAGRLKASYKISLADSIALAQAIVVNGELLTADHHEFDALEGKESLRLQWIR